MTLELCNGIIVFEVAAMLHDTEAEFVIIDFAHEAKSRRKYRGTFFKKYRGTGNSTKKYRGPVTVLKKVSRYFSIRYCSPLNKI